MQEPAPASENWDCHAHLFGPYARHPLPAGSGFVPPEATQADYLALLKRIGCTHGVLVHPSAYGEDLSLLEEALAAHANLRGVIVARDMPLARLRELRARGVRAARFSHRSGAGANLAGSASFADMLRLAPRLAEAGLHAELWTDARALPAIAAQLRALPVPVVIDHMGMFDLQAGVADPGFQALLALVAQGRTWVKLCAYRNLLAAPDPQAGRPFHEALVRANPQRLVWGSDWPHLRITPSPDAAQLLALLRQWTPDAARLAQILRHNPQALYQ
ncbi:MAG: amidohydrolase family protein [Xenophilus sp.]